MTKILSNYTSFIELMKLIDINPLEQRDRGTLFEYLVKAYLTHEPMYSQKFEEVWLLNEVPEEYGISKVDTGIDLIALNRGTKKLTAIQAKYYDSKTTIYKRHIDSFLNELGKKHFEDGILISSTDKWSNNAEEALSQRDKEVTRISLSQLSNSKIDWSNFSFQQPEKVNLKPSKSPRNHQQEAIEATLKVFETEDRGKLIMAPGTGKTYTSLIIAENLAKKKNDVFRVLYLVPSIQLLSQSLRGWSGDTKLKMSSIAVCSDRKVTKQNGKNDIEDITATDIGYPATTNHKKLLDYQLLIDEAEEPAEFVVVFSTYQSIDVISRAQNEGFYEFDLIIADEAHRTTGSTAMDDDYSSFVKVHDDENVKAKKRLYQTATPRVYGDQAKQKADEMSIVIADMADESIYGKEIYRLGFGDAVHRGILTDYKVMVLAVEEEAVQTQLQNMFSQDSNELKFNDAAKIIGCWNGLLKRRSHSNNLYGPPMKRAIAFTGTIAQSQMITAQFNKVVNEYLDGDEEVYNAFKVEIDHADGSMNALQKNSKIDWLKSDVPNNTCRILSNARFLTEGVDVPDLDAVMFLQPRRSTIDIAQAVGRVMRKTADKEYGYVILPIGIPSGKSANQVLDNHETYQVVWDVLNALRSIDERFDAMVNKIELNKKKPKIVDVIGVGGAPEINEDDGEFHIDEPKQMSLDFNEEDWSELERVIYAKIVQKVGNTRYWESWSKDVSELAQQHIRRINAMLESEPATSELFKDFLKGLHNNINESITQQDAVEMLAQHAITKPVFDALFEEESFALNNPVSKTMNVMIEWLEILGFNNELESLEGFYESVRIRAQGIDNLEAKQKIIVQLYEKFFKIGFPKTTESLGIVFTPIEVVDFIIHSIDNALKKHFNRSLSDKNVNILDPFTGTGTFITRLLQSGHIKKEDIIRKYTKEIHANEITLLSYYIAAINIEETFKELNNQINGDYEYYPFDGIVLTDTFDIFERTEVLSDELFGENNNRLQKQKESPITVIMGNPPYSRGQVNSNDNNQNNKYPLLDNRIDQTYSKYTNATLKNSLYDSYIRSFRWASDRIVNEGIIGFVTNASFIDSQSTDGLRKCWNEEFNYVYIFNLRGDQRTIGEQSRREGGKIFGSGSRTPVSITILVKDNSNTHEIYYHDIGDYLDRNQKLDKIKTYKSIDGISWELIVPDENNDWINQRDKKYNNFTPLDGEIFHDRAIGVSTNRDSWVYGFSRKEVEKNSLLMKENYNSEVERLENEKNRLEKINTDSKFIKWTAGLKRKLDLNKKIELKSNLIISTYRPFTKKYLNFDTDLIERPGRINEVADLKENVIYVTGKGASRDFSAIMLDTLPNLDLMEKGQAFYFKNKINEDVLFQSGLNLSGKYSDRLNLSSKDTFYYIYAILNSKEFQARYSVELKKDLPRIPFVKNIDSYVSIGKKLAKLHLEYEKVEPYSEIKIKINKNKQNPTYAVNKMKFGKGKDKSKIIYNSHITIENIPEKAYEYVVNGRSAIEWIMDQYQVKIDKKSGIMDNPNDFSDDPKYILNLLLSVINVSVQTVDLVNSMPTLEIIAAE